MATTVQVADATLRALAEVKRELDAPSYDAVLLHLLADHKKRGLGLRGLTPGIGRFKREHGGRD
ncbi:MAG: hypothetical protein ACYDCK_12575 [Thermoplasmatota archaeon]